jgi:hypothetical protein
MDIIQETMKEMKHISTFIELVKKHHETSDDAEFSSDASTTFTASASDTSSCTMIPMSSLRMIPLVEQCVKKFRSFLFKDIDRFTDFKEFMQYSLYSVDIYGLGQTLLYMLIETQPNLPIRFIKKMYKLIQKMMNHNVTERIVIKDLIEEYKRILQEITIT